MAITININGRITGEKDGLISVLDHGFLYGEGVYEVVRSYNGVLLLFDRHLQRLRRSADMIALPVPFSDVELEREVNRTIAAFHARPGHEAEDVYVRILVTRGAGDISYDPSVCCRPSVVILVKPYVDLEPEAYERGVSIAIVCVVRNHPASVSPLIKSNNLLNNVLAAQEAMQRGAFEGIMRNYRGEIVEGSISNFFVVRRGTVLTAPLDCGLLAGITRGFVAEIAAEAGVSLVEAVLHDEDVFGADEAFLTGSTREILPVVRVDDRPIGDGRPGPITKTLLAHYRAKLKQLTGMTV
jgi:branched-chain amino acid aminotransferase